MRIVFENKNELHARIFRFPTSALKYKDRKINYYDFLITAENEDCNEALLRMVPRINVNAICGFICEVPI